MILKMSPTSTELVADCDRCCGLCCVAPAFSQSADFAVDKPAHVACPNLRDDFRCEIHDHLLTSGFPGCVAYDCFGAGQKVVQHTFGGRSWKTAPELAKPMFEAFMVMRQLHELLLYLEEALKLEAAAALHPRLREEQRHLEVLTRLEASALVEVDVAGHRRRLDGLLKELSAVVRRA